MTRDGRMYLKNVTLENIRSHTQLELDFGDESHEGWHVIIGDNGAGKSTLVRAIALALAGPTEIAALRQDWRDWLRADCPQGHVNLHIDPNPKFDRKKGNGRYVENFYLSAALIFARTSDERGRENVVVTANPKPKHDPKSYLWGTGAGWFSASYGPFRRFTGGNKDYEKLFYSNPKLAPHLTVFGEDVALTEALAWLQQLKVRELEQQLDPKILVNLTRFINESGLLPHGTKLQQVTATSVAFTDGAGFRLAVQQLSDGYRSILSLTFELLRQLAAAYGEAEVWRQLDKPVITFDLPGVVMIDEIDAHLHPTWQRRIGDWFCRHFPQIQFIVTTHSPLVCQGASVRTIWQLPQPGDTSGARKIEGVLRDRLVYGSVVDALDTDLFGEDISRSAAAKQMLVQLAELNLKSLRGQLSADERADLERLRRTFPAEADESVGAE